MKLLVHVIEARDLQSVDGISNPYVRLQLGRRSSKIIATKRSVNPSWDKKISFKVGDLTEVLKISVQDEEKFFNGRSLGRLKIPLSEVLDANDLSLGTQWYKLQPKNKKAKFRDYGEIHLGISLSKNGNSDSEPCHSCSEEVTSNSDKSKELTREPSNLISTEITESSSLSAVENHDKEKLEPPSLVNQIRPFSNERNSDSEPTTVWTKDDTGEVQETITDPPASENQTFDKMLKELESAYQEMPENLAGGVLLDHSYSVSPTDLNSLLFSPTSSFWQSLADLQGTTGLQPEPWKLEKENSSLSRVVTYTKAASKLVKAVKATEKQTYLKANGKEYAVLLSVSTPDVPFGNSFRTEILFRILTGPELPSKESSSTLIISWRTNFLQSTMMKGMIESGARQGLRDSYTQFSELLSQNVELIDQKHVESTKDELLRDLEYEQESDLMLGFRFFGNFTVISSVFVFLYVVGHIMLAKASKVQGLEFPGLDLPDSIGEVVVCGVLVLQGQRVFNMISRYIQARKQRGSDNTVSAEGEGWLLTIALIEGSNLPAVNLAGYSDPYVVFACNGKIKTSTIKFQTHDPQWNEIFVFDAMDDPPSMMDIDVYDFDGPFDEAISLGHAEVNFVKSNLLELADVWIPLQGKLAQPCQSKLHLRVFLNNTRGNDVTKYLMKMEEKVGKKINVRSPQTNSAFQKIFNLPPEEFLINDFTCHLKRKMPLQGKLFLSPRIIGFYTNLFGHKTKFFFLWEDIEEIQIVPPSLASMGSPSLMIILCQGKGLDARHGAKSVDNDGRLRFQFQSFVSFSAANRTVMALWKARSLSPEQKMQIIENQFEEKNQYCEESESFLGVEDAEMSEVFSSDVLVPINSLMELFKGNSIEQRVMEKVGYVDYSVTPWEIIKNDVYRRQVNYSFNKKLLQHGGRVAGTQQKTPLPDNKGWIIEELMALQGIPLGDFFQLQFRYLVQNLSSNADSCTVEVKVGISWLKGTSHQKRITESVISTSSDHLKDIFQQLEKALLQESI